LTTDAWRWVPLVDDFVTPRWGSADEETKSNEEVAPPKADITPQLRLIAEGFARIWRR
jgi:hypothetical protein